MPELPEIETIRRKLMPRILDLTITDVTCRRPDLRFLIPKNLGRAITNTSVVAVRRRAKYLLLDFANGRTLIVHLGMSGRLFFTDKGRALDAHDHVLFDFSDGKHLRLRDPRRFGFVSLGDTAELDRHDLFAHLGPEPLEAAFDAEYLYERCRASASPIKSLIMDAKRVVGVGNIYANEALFLSGIRPQRKSPKVTRDEAELLCANIKRVLTRSIESGGTTFRDYVGVDEKPGLHQLSLAVYNREGQACPRCQTPIKRLSQVSRGSFYCPACQK